MKQASRSGWLIVLLAAIGIVCALGFGLAGYWQYVTSVPPFRPKLPPLPRPNGYDRALRAIGRLSQTSRPPVPAGWPNGTPEELHAQVAAIHPVLDEVRASFRSAWRTNPPLTFSGPMPEFAAFRECARGFAAESILAPSQGDYGTAMQRSLDAIELGVRLPRGGGLLHRLVGVAIFSIGFSLAEPLALRVPESQIPEALARVHRLRKMWPPLPEMLESERIAMLAGWTESFEQNHRQPLREQIRALDPFDQKPGTWELARRAFIPRRAVLAAMDRYFRQRIAESKKPLRRRVSVPAPDDPWSEMAVASEGATTWRSESAPTQLALLEVALAVRLYRREHGRYPAALRDVERRWLPEIPVDLWGQPVTYRLKDGQPLIYSLGPDGNDDGGLSLDLLSGNRSAAPSGDLVFGRLVQRAWPAPAGR